MQTPTARLAEDRCLPPVGSHADGQQAVRVFAVLQQGSSCAVAEEHAGVTILPVNDGGEFLRADHQHGVVCAGHDELLPYLERVNEPGAGRLDVECRGIVRA